MAIASGSDSTVFESEEHIDSLIDFELDYSPQQLPEQEWITQHSAVVLELCDAVEAQQPRAENLSWCVCTLSRNAIRGRIFTLQRVEQRSTFASQCDSRG